MKKNVLLFFGFCLLFSQTLAQPLTLFTELDPLYYGSNKYEIDEKGLESITGAGMQPVQLTLPVAFNGSTEADVTVQYQPVYIHDFIVTTATSNGSAINATLKNYYSGTIDGNPGSSVVIGFDINNNFFAFMHDGNEACHIENDAYGGNVYGLHADIPGQSLFLANDVVESSSGSGGTGEPIYPPISNKCIGVYLETTYDCFTAVSQNVNEVISRTTDIFAVSAAVLSAEGVPARMSQIFVWDIPDPYTDSTIFLILEHFSTFRTSFNGHIAQLIKFNNVTQHVAGVAFLQLPTCSFKAHSVCNLFFTPNPYPSFSETAKTMVHELGHNLGSRHTHNCSWPLGAIDDCEDTEGNCPPGPASYPATIMSYCGGGLHIVNGFGLYPGNKIRDSYLSIDTICLFNADSTLIPQRCPEIPTGITVSPVSHAQAAVSWNATGGTAYHLEYSIDGTFLPPAVFSTTDTFALLSGLTICNIYKLRVQSVCGLTGGYYSQPVSFSTAINASCKSMGENTSFGYIESVKINHLTNNSGDNNGYLLANCIFAEVTAGELCYLELIPGVPVFQPDPTVYWKVWIDIDQDNVFNDATELIYESGPSVGTVYANVLIPPFPLVVGNQFPKMRIAMKEGSNPLPCETYSFGETEDYPVRFVSPDYCFSRGIDDSEKWIKRVTVADLDHLSGSSGGYDNSSINIAQLKEDTTYTLQITGDKTGIDWRRMYFRAWIDYNDDKVLTSGEMVLERYIPQFLMTATQNFTVPATSGSELLMRIAMKHDGYPEPCEIFATGEVEDYTVKIIPFDARIPSSAVTKENVKYVTGVYPSPATERLYIELAVTQSQEASVQLINITGHSVYNKSISLNEGKQVHSIPMNDYAAGIYFLRITFNEHQETLKIMVAK